MALLSTPPTVDQPVGALDWGNTVVVPEGKPVFENAVILIVYLPLFFDIPIPDPASMSVTGGSMLFAEMTPFVIVQFVPAETAPIPPIPPGAGKI
jgi:hypothetical protein